MSYPQSFPDCGIKFRLCLGDRADKILSAFNKVPRKRHSRREFLLDFIRAEPELFPVKESYGFLKDMSELYIGFYYFFNLSKFEMDFLLEGMRKIYSELINTFFFIISKMCV